MKKKPEILGELWKLDTETQKWANAIGKDGTDKTCSSQGCWKPSTGEKHSICETQ